MKKDSWILRWETVHPLYRIEALILGHQKAPILGSDYGKLLALSDNGVVSMFYPEVDINRKGDEGLKIFSDEQRINDYFNFAKDNYDGLIDDLYNLISILSSVSNEELFKKYSDIIGKLEILLCSYDLSRPEFFTKLEEDIKDYLRNKNLSEDESINVFGILTSSVENHILDDERKDFLEIAIRAKDYGVGSDQVIKRLYDHQQKYGWIGTSESYSEWSLEYFKKNLNEQLQLDRKDILTLLSSIIEDKKILRDKQRNLEIKLKINSDLKKVLEVIRKLSDIRLTIRLKWVMSGFLMRRVFSEISQRTGIDKIDLEKYRLEEIKSLLTTGKKIETSKIKLRDIYAFLLYKNEIRFFVGKEGVDKLKHDQVEEIDYKQIDKLIGKIAHQGKVTGKVKIINALNKDQEKEISLMKQGEILVTGMTRPHLIMAIRKASAIVTDEGGITSHAAIIAREMKKPCIIGTKIATKVLKDGMLVEVDANTGIVTIINK